MWNVVGAFPRILLNGFTLTVKTPTKRRVREAIESVTTCGGTEEAPGRIDWAKSGLMLIVR